MNRGYGGGIIAVGEIYRMPRPKGQRPTVFLTPNGKKWCAKLNIEGKPRRKYWMARGSSKLTKTEAQRECDQFAATLNDPCVRSTGRMTFGELQSIWWAEKCESLRDSTADTYQIRLKKNILPEFGKMTLNEITKVAVRKWAVSLRLAQSTAKCTLRIFSGIWNWAIECELWTGSNPAFRVKAGGRETDEPGVVSTEDWGRICAALDARGWRDTALLVRLCGGLGCRVGEALGIQWPKVDLLNGLITIDRQINRRNKLAFTKESDRRQIPIDRAIVASLTAMPKTDEWVFECRKYINHHYRLNVTAEALGISCYYFGYHTGRRMMVTELETRGVSDSAIQRITGHKSSEMVRLYSRARRSSIADSAVLEIQGRVQ